MDNNHILLICLLLSSEIMAIIPEKYLIINGFLDIIKKGVRQALKEKPNACEEKNLELSQIN
jgi:hypothetical protein